MNGLMTGMSLTNDVNDAVQELILRDMHDKDVIGHVSASVSFTENVEGGSGFTLPICVS